MTNNSCGDSIKFIRKLLHMWDEKRQNKIISNGDLMNGHIRCRILKTIKEGLIECLWTSGFWEFFFCVVYCRLGATWCALAL